MKIITIIAVITVTGAVGFFVAGLGGEDNAPLSAPQFAERERLPDMTARTAIEVDEDCPYGHRP